MGYRPQRGTEPDRAVPLGKKLRDPLIRIRPCVHADRAQSFLDKQRKERVWDRPNGYATKHGLQPQIHLML